MVKRNIFLRETLKDIDMGIKSMLLNSEQCNLFSTFNDLVLVSSSANDISRLGDIEVLTKDGGLELLSDQIKGSVTKVIVQAVNNLEKKCGCKIDD